MITENTRKQLADYRKHGKKLKYLINYLMGLVEDEDDFENIIIREMKALAFNEDEIVECLEYHFGFDMSWHPMSVNYGKDEKNGKPRWKDLPFYERFAKQLKQHGVSDEMCEHIRERGKKKEEQNNK